jgi:hypothetical protein
VPPRSHSHTPGISPSRIHSERQRVIYNTACSPSTTLPWSGRTKIDTVAGRFVITSAIHRVPVLRRCRPTPYHSPAACLALGNVLLRGSSLAPNEIQPTRMPRTRARARPAPSNPRLSRRSWSPDAVQRTRRSDHLHLITLPTRHTGSSECDLKENQDALEREAREEERGIDPVRGSARRRKAICTNCKERSTNCVYGSGRVLLLPSISRQVLGGILSGRD